MRRLPKALPLVLLACLFVYSSTSLAEPHRVGGEFQIGPRSAALGDRWPLSKPTVSGSADGSFLVTWTDFAEEAVFGQRYDRAGGRIGDVFRVEDATNARSSAAAADAHGNSVVTWVDASQTLLGQRLDGAGNPRGASFEVTTDAYDRTGQVVAMAAGGEFVVAWSSYRSTNIEGQRYDREGRPVGGTLAISAPPEVGSGFSPTVAMNANGDFAMAWASRDGLFGQRFKGSGARAGRRVRVNAQPFVSASDLALRSDDSFVVVWSAVVQQNLLGDVFAQRYNANGRRIGPAFRVNAQAAGHQGEASVAMNNGGDFVVVWSSNGRSGSYEIVGQQFDANGMRVGAEFRVNSKVAGDQDVPSARFAGDGALVVAWRSLLPDGSAGFFGQRFGAP